MAEPGIAPIAAALTVTFSKKQKLKQPNNKKKVK